MKHFLTLITLLSAWIFAQGQIQIVASDSSGCAPIQVNFSLTGNLPPNVISYTWSSNGTPFGSQSNPSRIFTAAGSYSISVRIISQNAPPQTIQMAVPIDVFSPPVADFSAQPLLLCKDAPITFTDLSTQGSAPITAWVWAFGDGTVNSSQNPVKQYNQGGIYSVSLQAVDANGCDATEYKSQYVDVRWPDASFSGGPTSACNSPHFPMLTATNWGPGLSHQWDFGNGRGSTAASVQPIYNNNGSFTITHIITDLSGCTDTVIRPHFINIGNNQANIIASKSILCYGDTVFLSCNSTTGYGIKWNIGGFQASICDTFFSALTAGVYPITLEMTEPGGCLVRDSISVQFFRPQPDFEGDTLFACDPPFRVNFTNLSTGTQNMTYDWDFGDNKTSTLGSPSHVYGSKGTFNVTLIATDSLGCRARARKNSYVQIGGASPNFTQDPRAGGCKPLGVSFIPTAPTGTTHLWVFGDGDSSRAISPQHTYLDTGFYLAWHYIIDPLGCEDSAFGIVTVGDSVSAQFQVSDSTPCSGQEITFINTSTGDYNYQNWDFGGWGTSAFEHPNFTFRDTGYQYVTLIVSDRGCSDTLRVDSAVYVLPPRALVAGNLVGCDTPHTVFFRDSSIGAHRYWWDFGTGNPADTSTQRDPIFTYTQTGFYPVTHIVWNDSTGCSDTALYTVVVEVFRMRTAASPTSGCAPLAVQFQDNSIGSAIWRWDFGDGGASIRANPVHTYTQPGQYTATAVFFSAGACADLQQLTINVYQPIVRFQAADTNACAFQNVQFTDQTFSSLPKASWLWDFGDGTQSTASNPTHAYTRPGHFTVTLTVTDSRGCAGTAIHSQYIYVTSPIAAFSPAHAATCIGNPMVFTQFSTGQSALTYDWDFGDGSLSSGGSNQLHVYNQNGTYNSKLIVTDTIGCKDSLIVPVAVEDPDIDLLASQTFSNCPPLLVNFTANINSVHTFSAYQWDFGDGNGSNVQNPSHQYIFPGTYQVSLISTTASGCRDTFLLDSLITILGPQGSFGFQPLSGCAPFTINGTTQLTSTASNAIDFDDGNVLNGSPLLNTFSHTYTQAGVYYPVMILDDGMGCRISVTSTDSITVFPKPDADFAPSQATLCDTGSLQFLDRSTSASPLTGWSWDFGDNSGSGLQNPVHFYRGPGNYSVRLIVINSDGCRDTARIPTAIQVFPLPQASMRLSGIAGCTPFNLDAFDASPPGNAPIVDWLWDFGVPGASERRQNASFTYLSPGSFTVSLTIRDANGCVTTIDTTIEAWERPIADFSSRDDSLGCAPFPVTFLDKSRGPVPMAGWRWQFGNGDSSLVQNPSYTYQQDGNYDLQLIVTDARGCDDTLRKNEYIKLNHPVADFDALPTVGCPPLSVQFTDRSITDTSLVQWSWRFGDGGTASGDNPSYSYLNSGTYDVWLEVEDAFGCKDSIEKPEFITVLPDVDPLAPEIRYVTVESDASVQIIWAKYLNSLDDFGAYILEENDGNGWREILRSTQIDDTSFIARGLNTPDNRYCYRLLVENICKSPSDPTASIIHCAVQLEARTASEAIQLNWSAYQGWPLVDRYLLYRVRDYSPSGVMLIAEFPADSLSYLDTDMFCYDGYTYRVQAVAAHASYISQSNIDEASPEHMPQGDSLHIVRATVVEDNFVQLEWEKPYVRQGDKVVLERLDGNLWTPLMEQAYASANTVIEDRNTMVNVASYHYRGYVVDSCGDRLPTGREGRSILLQGERRRGTNFLTWTPYAKWENGVKQYEVWVFNEETQQQELVGSTDGIITGFEDYSTDFIQRQYCYTIRAVEEGGNDTIAFSNEVCLFIDPTIFAPTAFSPNGDGYNEIFYIPSTYVGAYKLEIFNRWGNKIFESSIPNEGWDGKSKGIEVPEGVYVWKLYATGLTGRPVIEQVGTVTLIR